jgi:2'-5' RNA ligase
MEPILESALVILVPEAEGLVESFREKYDAAAAAGVPAHITLLYPFKEAGETTPDDLDHLQAIFSGFPGFSLSLVEIRRFPHVVYLAPVPDQPIKELIQALINQFPENPPYGGMFSEIIPHLTVAELDDTQKLDEIDVEFRQTAQDCLPIRVNVCEVVLMDNAQGVWQICQKFSLAAFQP